MKYISEFTKKVNQVIYSSRPIYSLRFKTLALIVFIFLTREKYPNLQKAITNEIFFKIYLKVNKVIYSSLIINSPSFKALTSKVFETFC